MEITGGQGCVLPDTGGGTADLPPVSCTYTTPDGDMNIVDGLPVNTTIEIDASKGNFSCPGGGAVCSFPIGSDCREPGGTLGGEKVCADALLTMPMQGTGSLAAFNRFFNLPISIEIHHAPRVNGSPVQSFDSVMFRMFGQITAIDNDPDFELLRVVAGTDFGLPSPGHTTLTQIGGGNWAVDSFFDITYRIDFVGRFGGAVSGMSGSTTGSVRFALGNTPQCTGICPPGTACVRSRTVNLDGSVTLCCECKHPPVITQWRSVRTHPGPGPLPIVLDQIASGNGISGPTVETRPGGIELIEIDFDQPVLLVNPAAVTVSGRTTSYPAGVMGPSTPYPPSSVTLVSPTTLALTFSPALPNRSCFHFDVSGTVENSAAQPLSGDPDCNARALVGDTTMSGDITLSDAIWTKTRVGMPTAVNPEHDLNMSGGPISNADALAAKALVASPPRKALCP